MCLRDIMNIDGPDQGFEKYSMDEYVLEASKETDNSDYRTYFTSNANFVFAEIRDSTLGVGDTSPDDKVTLLDGNNFYVYAYVPEHTGDGAAPARAGYRYAVVNKSNKEIMAFMNSPATRATEAPLETVTASQTLLGEYNHLETNQGSTSIAGNTGEVDIMVLTRSSTANMLENRVISLTNGWMIYTQINSSGKSELVTTHNGVEQSVLTTTN